MPSAHYIREHTELGDIYAAPIGRIFLSLCTYYRGTTKYYRLMERHVNL